MRVWDRLTYFKKTEFKNSPDKINGALLLLFDVIRSEFGKRQYFIVNRAYDTGAKEKSQHRKGNAIDFYVKNISFLSASEKLLEVLKQLQVADFVGFGCYPYWNNPGFHLDLRREKARWGQDSSGVYFSYENTIQGYEESPIPNW